MSAFLLFVGEQWKDAPIRNRKPDKQKQHAWHSQLQRRSRDAPLFPATRGDLAFCATLLTRHSLPEVEQASLVLAEL